MIPLPPAPITSAEWAQWFEACGTLLAVVTVLIIALFQDKMRAWVMRPRLVVSINVTQPDCIKIPITRYDLQGREIVSAESYYFRLKVSNDGNAKAELVEVFGKELLEQQADGSFSQANWFQPMRLAWVPDRKPVASVIVPKTYKH